MFSLDINKIFFVSRSILLFKIDRPRLLVSRSTALITKKLYAHDQVYCLRNPVIALVAVLSRLVEMNNETSCNVLAHNGRPGSQVLRPSPREPTDTAKWDAWDGDPDQRPRIGRTRAGEGPVNGRGGNASPSPRSVHYPCQQRLGLQMDHCCRI